MMHVYISGDVDLHEELSKMWELLAKPLEYRWAKFAVCTQQTRPYRYTTVNDTWNSKSTSLLSIYL